ncbi:MAG: polysaccharide biosynthesis tyrosine autokinase [Cryomorphaceae bacterium]
MKEKNEIISRKDLVRLFSVVVANWYYLIIVPCLAFGISYIYTHRISDVYAAKSQILLKSNETYDYQQQIYKGLGFTSKYASYEETASQMRVIKSSSLLHEVLDHVPLNVSYYIVGRLKVSEVYKHMPFTVWIDERSSAAAGKSFNLSILDTATYYLSYEYNGREIQRELKFGDLIVENGLYLRVMREANLNEMSVATLSNIAYMFTAKRKESLIRKYQSSIDVENIPYTSIIEITLKDEIKERAVEILDTLANMYVENTLDNKTSVNENTLSYIDKQLEEVISIINTIEIELESFKEQKSILNLPREEENYFNRLLDLDNQLRRYKDELRVLDELTSFLLKNEEIESLIPPSFFVTNTDEDLTNRIRSLYVLREEYTKMLRAGTDKNPRIDDALDRIKRQKEDVLRYIDSQARALESGVKQATSEIQALEVKIKNIPKSQRQILNIERRLQVNEELYSFLLAKRAETVIAKAGIIPETKIIERAHSVGVVYPDKTRMNLISVLFGFGLAVVIIVLKEAFFQKVKNVGQLQAHTEISILGSIPRKRDFSSTYRILKSQERSEIVQAFRHLRTNLQFLSPSSKCTKVLVTSLLPGEGKTFTSVNLASVIALAEKKVLIIDLDLHKPRLATAMELKNDKGVSSFLAGQHSVQEVIQKTDSAYLDVITSGPIPPNASELILREQLDELFDFATGAYDFVFLDTPPISLITDGLVLMEKVDVKLFVLNSKSTSKASIDYIENIIDKNGIDNCALVLNEEKISRLDFYYSRYGYGYGGYGGHDYGWADDDHGADSAFKSS